MLIPFYPSGQAPPHFLNLSPQGSQLESVHITQQPVREQPLSSHTSQKTLRLDEEPQLRFPGPFARPITVMPLSRMETTTFAMPNIKDLS
ncbi:hypothetical protein TNCV_2847121 [Trichonephila clavipes]|nr:hypothetical protein TNCV_2847121 [Trichonephila clavipes]